MNPFAPYQVRPYTTPEGKWLVHGPTLPELGHMAATESAAKDLAFMLRDAYMAGVCTGERHNRQQEARP